MALDLAEFFRNYVASGVEFGAEPATEAALVADLIGGGKAVLDLGAGGAAFAQTLTGRGCTVESIPLAELESAPLEMLASAASYDVVLLSDILGFVREPEAMLQNCRGLLAPDGFIVASVANFGYGAVRLAMLAGSFEKLAYEQERNPRMHFFSAALLGDVFTRAGYRSEDLLRLSVPWDDAVADPRHAHVDKTVVHQLKRDPENATLMFVVKAAPVVRPIRPQRESQSTVEALERQLCAATAELQGAQALVEQLREAGRALQMQNAELRRTRPTGNPDEAESLRAELANARKLHADLTARLQLLSAEITALRVKSDERSAELANTQSALDEALRNVASVTASRDEFVKRAHAADSAAAAAKQEAQARAKEAAETIAALTERADRAEKLLLEQTNGLLQSTAVEIQKLSDLVNIVQTSRFWKLKSFAAKLLGR